MSKKNENNPAQPFIDTSVKALYAAAGVTDLLAERWREYMEARQEEARTRTAAAMEQWNQATERATNLVSSAPSMARNFPEQVQAQLEELLKEMNLSFEEMVRRGEQRLGRARHGVAGAFDEAAEKLKEAADSVDPETVDVVTAEAADAGAEPPVEAEVVEVPPGAEVAEEPAESKPAKKAPARKAAAKKAAEPKTAPDKKITGDQSAPPNADS